MMKLFAGVVAVLLGVFLSAGEVASGGVQILETGDLHGDEVDATAGADWWGVYQADSGFELRNVTVGIERVHDPIVNLDGEATGKRISVDTQDNPLFLVRGLPNAQEGPLKSAASEGEFLYPGQMAWLDLEPGQTPSGKHALAALGTAEEASYGVSINNYRLMLYENPWGQDAVRQELAQVDGINLDGYPTLIWAGDLDRDGRLDFYMDLTNHYNVRALTLFLSSAAKEGELVGLVAELVLMGC